MSLAEVGQHTRVLHDSGLVRRDKLGRVRTYVLQPAALRSAVQWTAQHRGR